MCAIVCLLIVETDSQLLPAADPVLGWNRFELPGLLSRGVQFHLRFRLPLPRLVAAERPRKGCREGMNLAEDRALSCGLLIKLLLVAV